MAPGGCTQLLTHTQSHTQTYKCIQPLHPFLYPFPLSLLPSFFLSFLSPSFITPLFLLSLSPSPLSLHICGSELCCSKNMNLDKSLKSSKSLDSKAVNRNNHTQFTEIFSLNGKYIAITYCSRGHINNCSKWIRSDCEKSISLRHFIL